MRRTCRSFLKSFIAAERVRSAAKAPAWDSRLFARFSQPTAAKSMSPASQGTERRSDSGFPWSRSSPPPRRNKSAKKRDPGVLNRLLHAGRTLYTRVVEHNPDRFQPIEPVSLGSVEIPQFGKRSR